MAINSSKITTDHDTIKKWVESRGGHPATVKRTRRGGQTAGLLRIDFPGFKGEGSLEEISWDEFFDTFDQQDLAFTYQNKTATGRVSRFNKLVSREAATAPKRGPGRPPGSRSRTSPRAETRTQPARKRGRPAKVSSSRSASSRSMSTSTRGKKRGPGRPPGSKNRPKSARARAGR